MKSNLFIAAALASFVFAAGSALAASHNIGVLDHGVYSDSQTMTADDRIYEGSETYQEVVDAIGKEIDDKIMNKVLDEVKVYAHSYTFESGVCGEFKISEASGLSKIPSTLKNISSSDLKNPLKWKKILDKLDDMLDSGNLYFAMVPNSGDRSIYDYDQIMPVAPGEKYHMVVFGLKSSCVGKSFSFKTFMCGNVYYLTADPNGGVLAGANFKDKEGTSTPCQVDVRYSTTRYNTLGKATKAGSTFSGWYTAKSGGEKVYDANGRCVAGSIWDSDGKWRHDGDLTIYARWSAVKTYTLTLNPNGGTVYGSTASYALPNETQTAKPTYGKSYYWRVATASRTGYTFSGWYTAKTGGSKAYDANGEAVNGACWNGSGNSATWKYDGNLTVYARWTPNAYTLTVRTNGGTFVGGTFSNFSPKGPATLTVKYGQTSYYKIGTATRPGYVFKGWYTGPKAGTLVYTKNGNAYENATAKYWKKIGTKAVWQYRGNLTIYAHWEKATSAAAPEIGPAALAVTAPTCVESATVDGVAYLPDGESIPVDVSVDADGFAVVELDDAVFCGYVADGVGELFSGDSTLYLVVGER